MTAAKPRLIFHVGLHKTGTTFLQHLFAANLDVFAAAGYEAGPMFDAEKGRHHQLANALMQDGAGAFLAALKDVNRTTLITSENFTHWINRSKDSELKEVATELQKRFDTRVVIFLRRQDFLKESVFAEVTSSWYRGTIDREMHYYYDFNALLMRIEAAFGKDNIGLGVYRDIGPNDLVGEFLKVSGIDLDAKKLRPIPPQRVSLSRRKVALLSQLDKSNRKRARFVHDIIQGSTIVKDDGIKYQMSPEARRDFLRTYREGNFELAKRFDLNVDQTSFLISDELHQVPWRPLEPFSEQELALLASTPRNVAQS